MSSGGALSGWWARELQRVHEKLNTLTLGQDTMLASLTAVSKSQERLEAVLSEICTIGATSAPPQSLSPPSKKRVPSESLQTGSLNLMSVAETATDSAQVGDRHSQLDRVASPNSTLGLQSQEWKKALGSPTGLNSGLLTPFSTERDDEETNSQSRADTVSGAGQDLRTLGAEREKSSSELTDGKGGRSASRSRATNMGASPSVMGTSPSALQTLSSMGAAAGSIFAGNENMTQTETENGGTLKPRRFRATSGHSGFGGGGGAAIASEMRAFTSGAARPTSRRTLKPEESQVERARRTCWWWFVCSLPLDPDANFSIALDGLSLIMLAYDLVIIPVSFAWDLPADGWLAISEHSTVVFWTVLMLLSFFKGYHKDETKVMSVKKAARHYLQTWFLMDFSMVCADWVIVILEAWQGNRGSGQMEKVVRFVPILRINRLVRLVAMLRKGRVKNFLERLNGRLAMWSMWVSFRLFLNLLLLISIGMMLNHWFACIYYAMGKNFTQDSGSWLAVHEVDGDFIFEYFVSFQWASAHMFGGSPVAHATTSVEFAFTIFADVMLGGIFGSTLVSTVATVMMRSSMLKLDQEREMQDVRLFMWRSEVPRHLFERIVKELSPARLGAARKVVLDDLPLLLSIPRRLRSELQVELYAKCLTKHSFFSILELVETHTISELCTLAIEQTCLSGTEDIFNQGEIAVAAYILRTGRLRYTQIMHGSKHNDQEVELRAGSDMWVAELALWSHWSHRGFADAMGHCELINLKAEQLEVVFIKYSTVRLLVNDFCRTVCGYISSMAGQKASDLPLHMAPLQLERYRIILQMPVETRMSISTALFEVHVAQPVPFRPLRFFKKNLDHLREEIEEGKCILTLDDHGKLLRVVEIACLRISCSGKVLVNMGRIDFTEQSGKTQVICDLPATKLKRGESPEAAVLRLVEEELEGLASSFSLRPLEREQFVEESVSKSYGMHTKYLRRIFEAELLNAEECIVRVLEVKDKKNGGVDQFHSSHPVRREERFDPEHIVSALDLAGDVCMKPMVVHAWMEPDDIPALKQHRAYLTTWLSELSPVFHFENMSTLASKAVPSVPLAPIPILQTAGSRALEGFRASRRMPTIGSISFSPQGSLSSQDADPPLSSVNLSYIQRSRIGTKSRSAISASGSSLF